ACVLPENPASYRVVRTKSYLFNKAVQWLKQPQTHYSLSIMVMLWYIHSQMYVNVTSVKSLTYGTKNQTTGT
ncbi:hypothetical protein V9Y44_23410, partial [Klebsiella pneumoniae]|uniref:hypothetical protein n=1 Tax=Klebsiella pneumoniae TaxID=573 RepID=UPI003131B8A2